MAAVSRQRVRQALEPVIARAGFDLEDVEVVPAGRRSVVRVVVDRDGGVDLDAVADISRDISAALDEDPVTGDAPYTLEVTSPGVDRPLTEPRHWRRAVGRLVSVDVREGGRLTGRVLDALTGWQPRRTVDEAIDAVIAHERGRGAPEREVAAADVA